MRKVLVLVPVAVVAVQTSAHAGTALDKPSFTATPAELLAVAKTAPAGDSPTVMLRDEADIAFDAGGKKVRRFRYVFVLRNQAGVDGWGTAAATWNPFYQDKPVVRARVIEPDGTVAELDPSVMSDAPEVEKSPAVYSDRRTLSAPLPRLQVGAIVEEEVVTTDRQTLAGPFGTGFTSLGNGVPTLSTKFTFSAPAAAKARLITRGPALKVQPRHEVKAGRDVWTLEVGLLPATGDEESYAPDDVVTETYLEMTTAPSWGVVAAAYRKVIDQRIADGPFALPAGLPRTASAETVAAIVAWLHRQIRYTGIEFGEASNVPWPPAETAKRGFGDCKDKATLLVALLRQAGVRADLALLSSGPGMDVDPRLPGLGMFDHAIVRAKLGAKELWIDATEDLTVPGRLPLRDQGRHALVIADDTRDLVTTPRFTGDGIREVRTFEALEQGAANLREVTTESGAFGADERAWFRDSRTDKLRESVTEYVASEYGAKAVDQLTSSPPGADLDKPFELTVTAAGARRVYTERRKIDVYLYPSSAFARVPAFLTEKPDAAETARVADFVWPAAHTYEVENRIVLPPGFDPPAAEAPQTTALGTASLTRERKVDGQTLIVTYRFDSGKPRLTAKELGELRSALRAAGDEEVHLVIPHRAFAAFDKGDVKAAIAEAQRLIALHPKEARHHDELATIYMQAGAGAAARREANAAVKIEPKSGDAYSVLGWVLQRDTLGTPFGFDADRTGAIAAWTKALALEPKHVGAAAELADALTTDANGRISWSPADLAAAAKAWGVAHELSPDYAPYTHALIRAQLRAGKASEAEATARAAPVSQSRDVLLVAAVAAADPKRAATLIETMRGTDDRLAFAGKANRELVQARLYAPAAALGLAAGTLRDGSMEATMAKRLTRHDEKLVVGRDPKLALADYIIQIFDPLSPTRAAWDELERMGYEDILKKLRDQMTVIRKLDPALVRDIVLSSIDAKADGPAGGPWRVSGDFGGQKFLIYVAMEGQQASVAGAPDSPVLLGRTVRKRIAARDLAGARQLMDWMVADSPRGARVAKLWGPNVATDDKSLAVAAEVLAFSADAKAIQTLEQCASSAKDARSACDATLDVALIFAGRWSELEKHASAWLAREPSAEAAAPSLAEALAHRKAYDEADRILDEVLAKTPGNHLAVAVRAEVAAYRGTVDEAVKRYDALTKLTAATRGDKADYAWYLAAVHRDLQTAVELARGAERQESNEDNVYALAIAEAELGDLKAAIDDTRRSMQMREVRKPAAKDYYAIGRVLEQLGLAADAKAAYQRVTSDWTHAPDPRDLAAQHLKALKP